SWLVLPAPLDLPPFPTRRSSDLMARPALRAGRRRAVLRPADDGAALRLAPAGGAAIRRRRRAAGTDAVALLRRSNPGRNGESPLDRKSTRLNSSHVKISYAVFCL